MRAAFILGGTGQIGRAIAAHLLDSGWRVTVGHRGAHPLPNDLLARGAQAVILDREESGALSKALAGGTDALIDVTAYTADHARQLLEVQQAVGAFVVISSSSVYRDDKGRTLDEAAQNGFPHLPDPIPDSQPTVAPGDQTYSTRKIAVERLLLDKAVAPVTILRPAAIHGPGSLHPREWWFVKRMLDGRPVIPLAYEGESRFHTTAAANIAALARVALDCPATRILNIADPTAPTVKEIGAAIARHMNYTGRIVGVTEQEPPPQIGRTPWSVPLPFVLDDKAALSLGYTPVTTYAQATARTCDWLIDVAADKHWREVFPILALYPRNLFDYRAEDSFLENASKAVRQLPI